MLAYEAGYSVIDTVFGGIWDAFETNPREALKRITHRITVPILIR